RLLSAHVRRRRLRAGRAVRRVGARARPRLLERDANRGVSARLRGGALPPRAVARGAHRAGGVRLARAARTAGRRQDDDRAVRLMAAIERRPNDKPLLLIALIAIVVRLAQVQLVQGETFAARARANQIRLIPVAAPRGLILDRHGVVLVRSRPSFVCALIPSEITDIDSTLGMLSNVLGIPVEKLRHRLLHHHNDDYRSFDEVQTYEPYGPVILATDLTPAQTERLAEAQNDLKGVDREEQPVRNYPYGKEGAHLFGYVGAIDEDEYNARKRLGYSPNDVVGKDGLENAYDGWLHGRAGGEQVEVNAAGALVRRLKPVDPVPGDTLVTTIDWRLQKIVEKNLAAELKRWGK